MAEPEQPAWVATWAFGRAVVVVGVLILLAARSGRVDLVVRRPVRAGHRAVAAAAAEHGTAGHAGAGRSVRRRRGRDRRRGDRDQPRSGRPRPRSGTRAYVALVAGTPRRPAVRRGRTRGEEHLDRAGGPGGALGTACARARVGLWRVGRRVAYQLAR